MQNKSPSVLGDRLRMRRLECGIPYAELGKKIHFGSQELKKIEADPARGTNTRVLKSLCETLECTADWLLGLSDVPPPPVMRVQGDTVVSPHHDGDSHAIP